MSAPFASGTDQLILMLVISTSVLGVPGALGALDAFFGMRAKPP
jgi:hypothetical protein